MGGRGRSANNKWLMTKTTKYNMMINYISLLFGFKTYGIDRTHCRCQQGQNSFSSIFLIMIIRHDIFVPYVCVPSAPSFPRKPQQNTQWTFRVDQNQNTSIHAWLNLNACGDEKCKLNFEPLVIDSICAPPPACCSPCVAAASDFSH